MSVTALLGCLGACATGFGAFWGHRLRRTGAWRLPSPGGALIGLVTNFFDTLGIGNFAPTTVLYRITRMVPDEKIPGTMNVGHALPVVLMGFLFITSVDIEPVTLVTMIVAAIVGSWFGAGVVSRLPRRPIQVGMAIALLVAAGFFVYGLVWGKPPEVGTFGLTQGKLVLGAVGIALLGALMTIGVGLYAPCMVLVSLLGMNPKASFPIMMGACAFLMPFAGGRFVASGSYAPRASLGLALGGIPGVLAAFYLVGEMDLTALKWLVVAVVTITAGMMLFAPRESDGPH